MTQRLSSRAFHDHAGLEDWRALYGRAIAAYRAPSPVVAAAFVARVCELAEDHQHHPAIDLRVSRVVLKLFTHDVGGLSERDVELARAIAALAAELRLKPELGETGQINITIDAAARERIMPFWQAVLGYVPVGDEDLVDPDGRGPDVWFQTMSPARTERNRVHIDVAVPHDDAERRVQQALDAGGTLLDDSHAPSWWVLADAEGNEACLATWVGRWWEE